MPDLIKSAAEQRQMELQQLAGRAKTKLELASQFINAILSNSGSSVVLEIEPEVVAGYGLTLAEAFLSGWEATNGLPNNVPKGGFPNVPSSE